VLASNLGNYVKDVGFSYQPFLPILGTGLVTSEGDLWKKQRLLVRYIKLIFERISMNSSPKVWV
jgi:hypothetical protein